MESLQTLVLVLTPLFVGFLFPKSEQLLKISDTVIYYLVFVMLTYIGIELAQVEGLGNQIGSIVGYVILLATLTIGFGLIGLMLFDTYKPWGEKVCAKTNKNNVSVKGSCIQVCCVIVGYVIGLFMPKAYLPPDFTMTALLMLLILLVGISLKCSGITLKQVLLNKRGVQVSLVFIVSVWAAGIVFALMLDDVNVWQGLALSSGFGWYSLSGVVITDTFGAVWGSVALCNDLIREFFALIFIPVIMQKYPSAAVGSGGATSMDFTLPVIQQSGGSVVVPIAISFGFIVNIIAPVAMVLFSSFA